jgi:hypothetical protein
MVQRNYGVAGILLLLASLFLLAGFVLDSAAKPPPPQELNVVYVSRSVVPDSEDFTPEPTWAAERQTYQCLRRYFFIEAATVLAQGTNRTPVPDAGYLMTSYRLTEIELPEVVTHTFPVPISGYLQPREISFKKVWRLTITGGPFPATDSGYSLYLDDTIVGNGVEKNGGLTTIIFDPTLLHEGARIGLSHGTYPPVYNLPETLHFERQPTT